MGSIDQLQIEITASSKDAKSAIDNLVTSLQHLNNQLGLKDGTKLVAILDTITKSANAVSGTLNNVGGKGLDQAAQKAEETDRAIQSLAKDSEDLQKILSSFSFPDFARELGGASFSKKAILGADASNGNYSVTETGFTSDIQELTTTERLIQSIQDDLADFHTPDIDAFFGRLAKEAEKAAKNTETASKEMDKFGSSSQNLSQGFKQAVPAIQQAIEKAREYKKILSDMESGKITFDKDVFDMLVKGYDEATEAVKRYKNELLGVEEKQPKAKKALPTEGVLSNLVELGEGLEKVGKQFDILAEKHIKAFKVLTTPLKMVAEEYAEKFKGMGEAVANFRKNTQAHLTKLSQFWKRTMKTFTFMLVRKAITAIIKEVGNAVQSLAMYSNAMGTAFNTDISLMIADFQYLGRSIVSVFAPLLNTIVPIIDAIVDRIAVLISYIGMLFAALGGGTSFTKAKKNVTNYAESLDSASKSAKNLTMGIDELNILNEGGGGGSAKPYDGWEDAWEEVDIPAWIQDIGDWLKDFWNRFFNPLKEAWDRAKQYLVDGFKTMIDSLKRMFGHITDDFLTMWNQEKTIKMFEQMLKVVGDLARVVRNLADNFDDAWQKGKVGLKILENLRDIASILVDHVRNVSYYMIEWAKGVKFDNLLKSFEELTNSAKRVADFIGGVFEDLAITVLDYFEWSIEEGTPHLLETIAGIFDRFDLVKLRSNLDKIWKAFEDLFKNIHVGTTNAIGNLGEMVAHFVNSKEFTDFIDKVVYYTKLITKERVEKVLTGLGKGILNIAKSLVKFVSSKTFQKFLEAIAKWIDNHSIKEIAGVLEKIAAAIAAFKFGAFASEKLSGFFQFATTLTAMKNLGTIAKHFASLGDESGNAAPKVSAFASAIEKLKSDGILGAVKELGSKFLDLHNHIGLLPKTLGSAFTAFAEFKSVEKNVENLALAINGDDSKSLGGSILGLIGTLGAASLAFTALLGFPAGIIAAGCVAAVAAIKGISDAVEQIQLDHIFDNVLTQGELTVSQVQTWYSEITDTVQEHVNKWKEAERTLTQDRGDLAEYTKTLQNFSDVFQSGLGATSKMADDLLQKYEDLGNAIKNYIDDSSRALLESLLSQRAYLMAQGYDVDQMIIDIYNHVETEKKAVDEVVESVEKAVKGLEGLKPGTDEYDRQMQRVADVSAWASEELSKWNDKLNAIKVDDAVTEIERLGNSISLAEFEDDWDAAAAAISDGIGQVTSTYTEKMNALRDESDELVKQIKLIPDNIASEEEKNAAIAGIEQSYNEISEELTNKTQEVLGTYSTTLKTQLEGVATLAHEDWQTLNPLVQFWYGSEDEYIIHQMELYTKKMLGQEGLAGAFNDAYDAIPDMVNPHVVESMQGIVESQRKTFEESMFDSEAELKGSQNKTYENVLNALGELDFDAPAKDFATKSFEACKNNLNDIDFNSYAQKFYTKYGASMIDNQQIANDFSRLSANEGAAAFSKEYRDYLEKNGEIVVGLEGALNKMSEADFDTPTHNTAIETVTKLSEWTGAEIESADYAESGVLFNDKLGTAIAENNEPLELSVTEVVSEMVNSLTTEMASGTYADKVGNAFGEMFKNVKSALEKKLVDVKTTFKTKITEMLRGDGIDVQGNIGTLFSNITDAMVNQMDTLGSTIMMTTIPNFIQTYLVPAFDLIRAWFNETAMITWWTEDVLTWFTDDRWMEEVFAPLLEILTDHFNNFVEWWDETFEEWWTNHLVEPWFTKDKWDTDIFTPLKENIDEHWTTFLEWWDTTLENWWNEHLYPWVKKWLETYSQVGDETKEITNKVFTFIEENISEHINSAKDAVCSACGEMQSAIASTIQAIEDLKTAMESLGDLGGSVSVNIPGFAAGGFPQGDLFMANEAGAELVGTVGGKTAVASNQEITGIADAVYNTGNQEAVLLEQLINLTRNILDKDPVIIGDKEIARMANNGQNQLGMNIIS